MSASLVWFRNDLRLADNPALHAACATGGKVALLYILDERAGAASRWWLHHSLAALGADIVARGGTLLLRRGDPARIIPALAAELGVSAVHAARAHEPFWRETDRALDAALKPLNIGLHRHLSTALFAPERITTKAGGLFGVYTPFSKACFAAGVPEMLLPAPKVIHGLEVASDRLEDWALLPAKPDWAGGMRAEWTPGEAGALARLETFLAGPVQLYAEARNLPAQPGTAKLSPHVHFGEISPRLVWHRAAASGQGQGVQTFLKELLWREFSLHLLWQHPEIRRSPIRPEFVRFPWADNAAALRAWQRGRTGIPIVDAGMRELWQTGWMHNRVRMICASFLVKHLLIPWQAGEAWFWDTLVDADEAANGASWQWVAGCGADAAPYFRIFNPVLQGLKFDPEGAYVRRFVPELAKLPAACIHTPWETDPAILAHAGVKLGGNYPRPVIDLATGRERALAAYQTLKDA
ncbi:deoxyribodipyrimidine photo-lyase [Acidocella sp. KAb 2-4]|uniref:cryptochrome/photolyase family protein n=1 Tax=Acidocella sp. KAb 2-4 TaxID=2885158 RepID=UPI001D06217D|nr:deoxyribodipyrimidine photo-lyase [Acidocella sp. KAb 2-4]MCB5943232.1 DNA photolyase family protein [Acidocella sp. KAb 2-4]